MSKKIKKAGKKSDLINEMILCNTVYTEQELYNMNDETIAKVHQSCLIPLIKKRVFLITFPEV